MFIVKSKQISCSLKLKLFQSAKAYFGFMQTKYLFKKLGNMRFYSHVSINEFQPQIFFIFNKIFKIVIIHGFCFCNNQRIKSTNLFAI